MVFWINRSHVKMSDNFFVTIFSTGSPNYFPNNSLSKFTVKLARTLQLTGGKEKWCVGLAEYSHNKIKPAADENKDFDVERYKFQYLKHPSTPAYSFYFDDFVADLLESNKLLLLTNDDFFNTLNSMDANINEANETTYEITNIIIQEDLLKEHYPQYNNGDVTLTIKYMKRYILRTLLQELLFKMPGGVEEHNAFVFAFKKKFNEIKNVFQESKETFKYMHIYTDLIIPRIIGDQLTRILYTIPIDENKTSLTHTIINKIQYCELEKDSINEISIILADQNGEQIDIRAGSFATSVVLHFKKIV